MIHVEIHETLDNLPFNLEIPNIFYQDSWYRILQNSLNCKQLFISVKKGNKFLFLSGSLIRTMFFKIFYSNIPYGGFLGDYELIDESMKKIESEIKKFNIDRIYLTRNFFIPYPDIKNYKVDYGYQTILNLDKMGIQNFQKAYKEKIKRNVKKAEQRGVTILEDKNGEFIGFFYEMYVKTIKRKKGIKYWNEQFFKMICDEYLTPNRCSFIYAIYEKKPVAALLLLKSKNIIHYFAGVSNEDYLFVRPNDILFFYAIQRAIEEGFDIFDFMHTEKNDKNLLRFKEKWGSVTYKFYKFYKDLSLKSNFIDVLLKLKSFSFIKSVLS